LSACNETEILSTDFRKNTKISDFMKSRPVGAEFIADSRRGEVTKLIVAFRNFVYTPKKCFLPLRAAVAQWLRCCATNRKVAGSIPAGVTEFFIDIKSFRSHYGPGVDSASNRNEYQEYFLGVKAAGA